MQITIHYGSDLPTKMAAIYILTQGRDITAGALYTTVMQITVHYDSDLPTKMAAIYILAQDRDVTAALRK